MKPKTPANIHPRRLLLTPKLRHSLQWSFSHQQKPMPGLTLSQQMLLPSEQHPCSWHQSCFLPMASLSWSTSLFPCAQLLAGLLKESIKAMKTVMQERHTKPWSR